MTDVAPAVLFDIDGTLIDSNYLHIQAWTEAFADLGRAVDTWRIHRAIGMDASKLLSTLLGEPDADELGDRAKAAHATHYERLVRRLRPFSDAVALLRAVADSGLAVVLATSAPESELKHLRAVLDAEPTLTAVTSAEDVDTAKPAPDLMHVALRKAGVGAESAVMVGDSVWDAEAAGRAGVPFVGVCSGGISAAELFAAGAAAVYQDPADLLRHLRSSPINALLLSVRGGTGSQDPAR